MPACLEELKKLIAEENLIVGQEAIELSGMQDSLIKIIATQNLYFKSMTTFMVNDPKNFPPFNSPGSPKPSYIHSKTSKLVGGYIPIDPIFTRLDANREPLGHHYHDDLTLHESIQVKWTLWEILKRCGDAGDLYIDWPKEVSSIVRFRFKENKGPVNFDGCFQLNLGEEREPQNFDIVDIRVVTRSYDDPEKYFKLIPSNISEMFFKNPKEILYLTYKIFYSKEKNATMQPLEVLGINGKPIISDWDKDLESLPLKTGILDLETANKEYYTFLSDDFGSNHIVEQMQLIKATKKLFLNLLYKNFTFQDQFNELFLLGLNKNSKNLTQDIEKLFNDIAIKTCLLERAGVITPYEFLTNILTNHVHNCHNSLQGLTEYFNDPCQHGVASRTPFFLDKNISNDEDGPRFHILISEDATENHEVYYIYTINDTQRIKLYLIKGILESNFIHVSHWLDMSKWFPIIDQQILLGQKNLISKKTIDQYLLYSSFKNTHKCNFKEKRNINHNIATKSFIPSKIVQSKKNDEEFLFNFNRRRRTSVIVRNNSVCHLNIIRNDSVSSYVDNQKDGFQNDFQDVLHRKIGDFLRIDSEVHVPTINNLLGDIEEQTLQLEDLPTSSSTINNSLRIHHNII